ncbi:hypothetical protein [Sphingomonas agri]|uniref:hypothetical protein n=1 Tax=Sphingomonas agri TaxID=1813878 RepID=UPI00311FD8AE
MKLRLAALTALTLLGGCRHAGDLTSDNGGGVYAVRSTCPITGIPAGTGDVTIFNPSDSRDSRAIDVTAAITQLRAFCQDAGNDVVSTITFTVVGLRRDAGPARQVILPYFDVALRGGSSIAAKQIGAVALNFPAGSQHATTRAQASVRVNRSAATLPASVRAILTRPRKAGEAEAAIDPLAEPGVRSAVANATFEHLVGFQLTQDQLKYNATR